MSSDGANFRELLIVSSKLDAISFPGDKPFLTLVGQSVDEIGVLLPSAYTEPTPSNTVYCRGNIWLYTPHKLSCCFLYYEYFVSIRPYPIKELVRRTYVGRAYFAVED